MSSSEDEAVAARRRLIAKSLAAKQASESSSESSSSEESVDDGPVRLKPVFVPKGMRTTLIEQEEKAKAEAEAEAARIAEHAEYLKRQTQRAVEEAKMEERMEADEDDAAGAVPPIGIEDTEEEYQLWRLRELKRILKYRLGKDSSDDEALAEAEAVVKHKGAFYRGSVPEGERKPAPADEGHNFKQFGGMKDL